MQLVFHWEKKVEKRKKSVGFGLDTHLERVSPDVALLWLSQLTCGLVPYRPCSGGKLRAGLWAASWSPPAVQECLSSALSVPQSGRPNDSEFWQTQKLPTLMVSLRRGMSAGGLL